MDRLPGILDRGRFFSQESDPTDDREELPVNAPKVCPNCGTESIEPTLLWATMSVSFDGMPCTISGLHAYRCTNSHFFIVLGNQAALQKSDSKALASRIFV